MLISLKFSHKELLLKKKISLVIIIIELLVIINIILHDSLVNSFSNLIININNINKNSQNYYDMIFDSIEYDHYNISLIYNYSYNNIKIKHMKNKKYSKNSEVCIFGILANEKGLEIANLMIKWLLPEYDVYCVYQKYPGKLFEFPALRFAQWLSLVYNIKIILYIHTKGAFHQASYQQKVRKLWKYEFTSPRKNIYIKLIENNLTDISLPFRAGPCTWFNGMFISNRAFSYINPIKFNKNRWSYESLFIHHKMRFKGILNDKITPKYIYFEQDQYLNKKELEVKMKSQNIQLLILLFCFFLFMVYLKILNLLFNDRNIFIYKK